jgi:N-methylhydantoinase B/oxoprolinase/acetone carboxylase alpha subunit
MRENDFAILSDLVRKTSRDLFAAAPDIIPVHAGLFDAKGKPLLVSLGAVLPSMVGALASVRAFFGNKWQPGDVALTNDMDAGAVNACEIIVVGPIFSDAELVGWSVVRGRIPDFGGWEPGGYSPQAVDRWAEGARLEPAKVMVQGTYRREVTDLLRLNSRTPTTTLANIHLLAEAAMKLGQLYKQTADFFLPKISVLRSNELMRVQSAIAKLPNVCPRQQGGIVARWLNQQFGSIEAEIVRSATGLSVTASGPPVAKCPINLGQYAAQDIITAAISAACELDDILTDALSTQIHVSLNVPSLLCATIPATVGLGRHISGHVLFQTVGMSLGLSATEVEAAWEHYRDITCGTGFDANVGKLSTGVATKLRERQSKEAVA